MDIFKSLNRNGVRRVIVLNGHGGNRETLIRAGRAARDFDVVVAIPEWWSIGKEVLPELHPEKGSFMQELAVSLFLGGKEIADLRGTGYKGEWGEKYTMRDVFGEGIKPVAFNKFEFKSGSITIPVQAWDLDEEGPPVLGEEVVDDLYERGKKIMEGLDNIVTLLSSGNVDIPIDNETLNHVLLIDVLQEISDKDTLLVEIHRILKPDGVITVYSMHIDSNEVIRLASNVKLRLKGKKFQERILVFEKL